SAVAGFHTDRIAANGVCSPPSNRISASAIVPSAWAVAGLSNGMPPMPRSPASMPTIRNSTSTGSPSRAEARLETTPSRMSTAARRRSWSITNIRCFPARKGRCVLLHEWLGLLGQVACQRLALAPRPDLHRAVAARPQARAGLAVEYVETAFGGDRQVLRAVDRDDADLQRVRTRPGRHGTRSVALRPAD